MKVKRRPGKAEGESECVSVGDKQMGGSKRNSSERFLWQNMVVELGIGISD